MKTPMKKILTALAVAIGLTTAASAATPELVWEGNSATETKTMSKSVEKGKSFTLIVSMPKVGGTTAGSYIMSKVPSAGNRVSPFCIASAVFTDFNTSGNIPKNSFAASGLKSGGYWIGAGSRSSSDSASWKEEKQGTEASNLESIYFAYTGTVAADGTVSEFRRLLYAHKVNGKTYSLSDNSAKTFSISESIGTVNFNTTAGGYSSGNDTYLKIYLDYTVRTIDQIKAAIDNIENPPTQYEAMVLGNTNWSAIDWGTIADPSTAELNLTVENDAVITMDNTETYKSLNVSGNVTFKYAPPVGADDYDAAFPGGRVFYPSTRVATTITPVGETVISYSTAASTKEGYDIVADADGSYIVADSKWRVGSLNVSFPGGPNGETNKAGNRMSDNASYSGINHGAYPVVGAKWNDVPAVNNAEGVAVTAIMADGTVKAETEINVALSNVKNPYDMSGNSVPDRLLYGYCDDGDGSQATITGIPYSKYRIVVYFACDTAGGVNFGYAAIADGSNDAVNYCGSAKGTAGGNTVKGTGAWGYNVGAPSVAESVNYLVSDVMTSSTASVRVYKGSGRGGFAGFQVIDCSGKDRMMATDFAAEINGETQFSEIEWTPEKEDERPFFTGDTVTITNTEDGTTLVLDKGFSIGKMTIVSEPEFGLAISKDEAAEVNVAAYDLSGAQGQVTFDYDPGKLITAPHIRYNLDMGEKTLNDVIGKTGTYEFGAATLNGAGRTTATLKVVEGDEVTIRNGSTKTVNAVQNFDVTGGALNLGEEDNGAIWWGDGSTGNISGGKVIARANGTGQSGSGNGLLLGFSGGCTVNVTDDGELNVENSSINFWSASTINVTGGKVKAGGVFKGSKAGTVNVGENGMFELGAIGWKAGSAAVTLGGKLRAYESTVMANDFSFTNGAKIVAAPGTTIFVKGTPTQLGEDSLLVCGDDIDDGDVVMMAPVPAFVTGTYKTGCVVTVNDLGKFKIPEGKSAEDVVLFDHAGNPVEITGSDETYVYFEPFPLYGTSCLMEYLFQGNIKSTGSDTGSLQFDGTHCFTGDEYVMEIVTNVVEETEVVTTNYYGIKAASAPWRDVSFPSEVTVVMYGKVMKTDNTCQIGIGSTTGGSKYSLFLASGDVEKEEVKLCYAYNNYNKGDKAVEDSGVLCTMTVPHAQTADHLYAFTLKQVGDDTVVSIYLDGEVLQPYTFADKSVKLGSGIQLGSIHGGIGNNQNWPDAFGFKRSTAVETDATLQFVRVYDVVLNDEVMRQMAEDSPYVSPAGSFERTLAGDAEWTATDAWTKLGEETPYAKPDNGSSVTVTPPADDATLTVNLGETETFESMTIEEGGMVTFAKGEGTDGKVAVSGRVTAKADVTFNYDAFSMANAPLTVKAGKKVTFDLSMVDMTQFFLTQTYDLTGYATLEEDAEIAFIEPEELYGREISADIDPNTRHYIVTVTAPEQPFTYTSDGWKWGEQGVTAATVSNNTAVAIEVQSDLEWPIDRSAFTVTDGTLKAADKPAANCAIAVNGGVLDLNGNGGTKYAITLNGGTLANAGSGAYVTGFTVEADSSVNVPADKKLSVQSSAEGWDPTTITLGENTLAKTGEGDFILVATTIDGTGTLDIQAGKVYSSESVTFTNGTIKIGAGATYQQRDGERTTKVAKIVGAGGTLNNEGVMPGFELSGTLTIADAGNYTGTITNAPGTVVTVGKKRGLTFAGAGTVNVTLTDDEVQGGAPLTVFDLADEATAAIGTITYNGKDITDDCEFEGNTITKFPAFEAKAGNVYYLTFAEALDAAAAGDTVALLKDVTTAEAAAFAIAKNITVDFGTSTITKTVANDWVFQIADGADVTFKGSTGGIVHYPAVLNQVNPASMVQILGKLTVEGGVYESDYTVFKVDEGNGAKGELVVNGGSFTIAPRPETAYTGLTYAVMNWSKATLNGGTFTGDVTTLSNDGNADSKAGETVVDGTIEGTPVYKLQVTGSTYENVPKIKGVAIADVTLVKSLSITDDLELVESEDWVTVQKKSVGPEPVTPGEPVEVEAETEQEALDKVTIVAESPDPEIVSTENYTAYFKKVATEVASGTWMVAAVLTDDIVQAAEPTAELADGLGDIAAGTATSVTVTNAKPGLYYSVKYTDDVTGIATADEGVRTMADAYGSVTIATPVVEESTKMFYQIQVNTTQAD